MFVAETEKKKDQAPACAVNASTIRQVFLRKIALSLYRNYRVLKMEVSSTLIVLTGDNGAGKTNLLEAISFLSPGRGFRRTAYRDVVTLSKEENNEFQDTFALNAQLECSSYGEISIGMGLEIRKGEGKRRIHINGAPSSSSALLEYCRILWQVPAMDRLFIASPGERRRFLDRMVLAVDPLHGRRILDYDRAMRARNHLLTGNVFDTLWLDALEVQIAKLGTAIASARLEIVRFLHLLAETVLQGEEFPKVKIHLKGFVEETLGNLSAVDTEELFRCCLRDNRKEDSKTGRALSGIHCTDLAIVHKEKEKPAALCSTGEQKALLTGLVLCHARLTGKITGMTPVLLLDEIVAHLDFRYRHALFDILKASEAQTFMTGTDRELFKYLRDSAEFFFVHNGTVTF